jgi:hypothetical protein
MRKKRIEMEDKGVWRRAEEIKIAKADENETVKRNRKDDTQKV